MRFAAAHCMRLLVLSAAFSAGASHSRPVDPQMPSPDQALVRARFDPERATRAYLAKIPPDQKVRSDAYFEGGCWLTLWNFLYEAAVLLLLLTTRWSARLRDWAERRVRFKPIQTITYWAAYSVITTVLAFPLTVYERFFREHAYGLSNQTLGAWLGDFAKEFVVGLIFGGILIALLYVVVRRIGQSWWIWGSAVSVVFLAFFLFISPIVIAPLFNKYTPISDERVRDPILRMARANGIQVQQVYQVDESRQSKRISANVSGFLGTERISLNDNLLKRASLPEIEAVMGHEMGHYLLHQMNNFLMFFALYFGAGFALVNWSFHRALRLWGEKWGVRGIGDTAGYPLAFLVGLTILFVTSPLRNSFIRVQEYEADIFGLNAARQPDGAAEAVLKLSEYRKLDPGPLEEWIFYDHPSGRMRIYTAMQWKAENMPQ